MTKVRDVIRALTTPEIPMEDTVDKLLSGDMDANVTGIASTFLATQKTVEEAKRLGANFIVSHEGIFYSHRGDPARLAGDPVYEDKLRLIRESGMAIFRYHDYVHAVRPDVITAGLLQALDWQSREVENKPIYSVVELPDMTLANIVSHLQKSLNIHHLRFIGDPQTPVRRLGVYVGYRGGGEKVIANLREERLDAVLYGEGPEWETAQYFRDALQQGKSKGLIVLGHGESEAPGMEMLAQTLRETFPNLPVHFIPEEPLFQFV